MIRNYIKTAVRTLTKNKGFTAINVLGLALGLAACLLIVFYVFDELSYDRFNIKADRIFRVNNNIKFGGNEDSYAVTPAPAAAALKADFPEIEQVARMIDRGSFKVKKGNQDIQEYNMIYADPTLFDIFTIPMIHGNPATALKDPNSVVITDEMAEKYFKSLNVIGQTLTFNDSLFYKVTGVIKKMPKQSHFNRDFFISMSSLTESRQTTWLSNNFTTYILLRPNADPVKLQSKFHQFLVTHAEPELQILIHTNFANFEKSGNYFKFSLSPLKSIHLQSQRVGELGMNGSLSSIYIFSSIAIFLLLIACVNFMNLSTARSASRAREVGVRKVLGSPRKYLIFQFLTESFIVTLIATVIAVVAAWLLLPAFNNLANKDLVVTPQILSWLLPVLLLIVLIIGGLAGSYPAFFLSGFQPIQVLKGKLASGFKGGLLRSSLVVFQFFISIFLIIGTIVIYDQLKFIENKDLGYNRDHVLIIQNVWQLGNNSATFKSFRDEVKQLPGVKNVSLTGYLPTSMNNNSTSFFKDPVVDQKRGILSEEWFVDENYIPTLSIKMASGRNFSDLMPTDTTAVIINEAAAKILAFNNPLNQPLYSPNDPSGKTFKQYHIIGVMKDFNYRSLKSEVKPLIIVDGEDRGAMAVQVRSGDISGLISQIKSKWTSFAPNQPFSYAFMDEEFDKLYRTEQRTGTIFVIFTSLAIIIACLGLFGLAAYAAEQRTKEIGIRKVLGASMSGIVGMLSRDFIKLVLIAIVIASPLAWYAMNYWLQDFAYRIHIQWWVIALAGAAAIIIAFVTISFQSIKAALTNPVKSLRSE
jgi:putative ABC transport system permease protein